MDRIDKILNHDLFIDCIKQIQTAEADRSFCRHDMAHFLDVARIAMILNLEEQIQIDKELIYGAALLHDIGRHVQYAKGTPHEQASAEIAPKILADCGFDKKETSVIIEAIRLHRTSDIETEGSLNGILYRADKASRACFCCQVQPQCDWKHNKKNLHIGY